MQDNFLSTFLSNNRGIIKVRLIYIYKRIIPKFQTFPKSTTIFRLRLKPQYRQINVYLSIRSMKQLTIPIVQHITVNSQLYNAVI